MLFLSCPVRCTAEEPGPLLSQHSVLPAFSRALLIDFSTSCNYFQDCLGIWLSLSLLSLFFFSLKFPLLTCSISLSLLCWCLACSHPNTTSFSISPEEQTVFHPSSTPLSFSLARNIIPTSHLGTSIHLSTTLTKYLQDLLE